NYLVKPVFDTSAGGYWNSEIWKNLSTDSEGQFRIDNLPNVDIKFWFFKSNYKPISDTTIPMDNDDNVITLYPEGRVAGSVVDDITGKPIKNFKVSVAPTQEI